MAATEVEDGALRKRDEWWSLSGDIDIDRWCGVGTYINIELEETG